MTKRSLRNGLLLLLFVPLLSAHNEAVIIGAESGMFGSGPIAEGNAKFLGNIYSPSQLPGFTDYWNQVTPENAGKWGSVESTRDVMNWAALDAAYALAKNNDFPYRHHVLIWGNQQPAWIENLPPAEQLEEIKEWMQAVAQRYPDIDFVEVVNEALHDPPNQAGNGGGNYINALGGGGATGWDWVLEAFRLARTYFPNAKLLINDYNIVNNTMNVQRYLEIIQLLKARNLIDQVGVQGHSFSLGASADAVKSNLDLLATAGLPIYVTELDVDGPTDQVQLANYQRLFPVFWEHPAVRGVTLWGWRTGMWRTQQMAYLIAPNSSTERPALVWLRNYVQSTTSVTEADDPDFLLYPNPVTNSQITLEGVENVSIRLIDARGRQLAYFAPTPRTRRTIPVNLPPGIYTVELFDGRRFSARKLVVR